MLTQFTRCLMYCIHCAFWTFGTAIRCQQMHLIPVPKESPPQLIKRNLQSISLTAR